jgi:two-component sensor histidine kinase
VDVGAMAVRHHLSSAALVRDAIAEDLRRADITRDTAADVILVASELVGNAVVHTPDEDGLDVSWDVLPDAVMLTVHDGSSTLPCPRHATGHETSGRGLAIVAALSADWGVDATADGKQVWARIPVSRSA